MTLQQFQECDTRLSIQGMLLRVLAATLLATGRGFVPSVRRAVLKQQLLDAALAKDEPRVLALVDELAPLSPTRAPTRNLGVSADCPLAGPWRLAWTNARDAEAPARTENRLRAFDDGDALAEGVALETGQTIDAAAGLCRNFIRATGANAPFDELEIDIALSALGDRRVRLDFLRGRARNARAPLPFLRDVRFGFPPASFGDLVARLRGRDPSTEPPAFFDVLYLDDALRCHRTGEGKVFVQARPDVLRRSRAVVTSAT